MTFTCHMSIITIIGCHNNFIILPEIDKYGRFKNYKFCRKIFSFEDNKDLCHSSPSEVHKVTCLFIKINYKVVQI